MRDINDIAEDAFKMLANEITEGIPEKDAGKALALILTGLTWQVARTFWLCREMDLTVPPSTFVDIFRETALKAIQELEDFNE